MKVWDAGSLELRHLHEILSRSHVLNKDSALGKKEKKRKWEVLWMKDWAHMGSAESGMTLS